ncbi:MAG: ABC transporter ATP-binding protein [Gemmatimonadota bacterium]
MTPQTAIRVRDLTFRYPGAPRAAVHGVSLDVEGARHLVILGPNGSGKSTLLRCMLGRARPQAGSVSLFERPLTEWGPRELARLVGVVPQEEHWIFPLTVREAVALGRYPHLGPWRREGPADQAAVDRALARCDATELRDRRVETLSGGERQRVRIARALAQEPRILVLDEPTIHLDVRHEMEIFELLHTLVADAGITVITVTHNLNLSARYADRLALLKDGALVAEGTPESVLTPRLLQEVFDWPVTVERDSQNQLFLVPESGYRGGLGAPPGSQPRDALGPAAREEP